jgi:hypothetical protein
MGAPFSDISLYTYTPYKVGTAEYLEEISLINFVSDLYVQNMEGYKPPKTSRITIQPAFHDKWLKSWKSGSIVHTAPYFNYDQFSTLAKKEKYKYILDLIQHATTQLCDDYKWDKVVFENAYNKTLESNFTFKKYYPSKQSRDRKKSGVLIIRKTETISSAYIEINNNGSLITRKLFDKKNRWWYVCIYTLARSNKWFDNDRFGISFSKGKIDIWYSIENDTVNFYAEGNKVISIDFSKYFSLG